MNQTIQNNQVYTATQAAEILGVQAVYINKLCSKGIIKATKVKTWRILGENLLVFMGSPSASNVDNSRYAG